MLSLSWHLTTQSTCNSAFRCVSVTGPPGAAVWTYWSHPAGWWWACSAASDRDSWSAPGTRPRPGSRRWHSSATEADEWILSQGLISLCMRMHNLKTCKDDVSACLWPEGEYLELKVLAGGVPPAANQRRFLPVWGMEKAQDVDDDLEQETENRAACWKSGWLKSWFFFLRWMDLDFSERCHCTHFTGFM